MFNFENCPEDYFELKKEARFLSGMTQYSFLLMAQRLKKIKDGQLYKKDGYSDFKAFVEKEMPISRQTAYKYIDIITYFDVALERQRELDYTKLVPVLPLLKSTNQDIPKEELKTKFINEISLKTKKELEEEAKKLKIKYGIWNSKKTEKNIVKMLMNLYGQLKEFSVETLSEEQKEIVWQIIEYLKTFVGYK